MKDARTMRSAMLWSLLWGLALLGVIVWIAHIGGGWLFGGAIFLVFWMWNAYQRQRLQRTLLALETGQATIPSAPGAWGEAYYALHRASRHWFSQLAQVQQTQQRFMLAIQASPNAFVMLDDAGRLEWINAAAQSLLGLDAQRDVGQNLAYLLRTPAVHALLDSQRLQETMMLTANDKVIKVQAFPYGEAQTLLLGQDLTEIARTDQVRRDFVANVSHELRTPLTVLAGYHELLQDYCYEHPQSLPQAMVLAIEHMVQHTHRMSVLTRDLLLLAQLDAGQSFTPDMQNHRVADWLDRVQSQMLELAHKTQLNLVFEPLPLAMADGFVRGVGSELDSALSNLISNALRYSPTGGTVRVSARTAAGRLRVDVTDTGCGIAPQHLPRLTERFYRVSASRSRDSGGTGLGLAIVKHIMLRHQGELHIQSALDQGSIFSLELPLVQIADKQS